MTDLGSAHQSRRSRAPLDRPNPARNAEGSFVFGVDDEVGLHTPVCSATNANTRATARAREALSAK